MKTESPGQGGKIVGALLIGAAIGAALGLLFAPASGKETRRKIFNEADEFASDLKDRMKGETAGSGSTYEDPEKNNPV